MELTADRGLYLRMGLALVLVTVLPVAFVYVMLELVNSVGLWIARVATGNVFAGEFYLRWWFVGLGVVVGFAAQLRYGESVALQAVGAKRVTPEERPDLVGRVDRLAQSADVPPPRVAVADSEVPNSFVVGRGQAATTLVVSEGLLETLAEVELDAVIAHELAHVKNRDATVMSLAYFLPTVTYLLAMGASTLLQGIPGSLRGFGTVNRDSGRALLFAIVALVVSAVLTLAVSAIFWLGSFLLFRVLSRYREYAADRGAVAITGDPAALASALRVVDDEMASAPDRDLREQDGGLESLYLVPIDDSRFSQDRALITSDMFPDTHPPTGERIDRLRAMETEGAP